MCGKCKASPPSSTDSWCNLCRALEVLTALARRKGVTPAHRILAEDLVLATSRQVEALFDLDRKGQSQIESLTQKLQGRSQGSRPAVSPRTAERSTTPKLAARPQANRSTPSTPVKKEVSEKDSEEGSESGQKEEPEAPPRSERRRSPVRAEQPSETAAPAATRRHRSRSRHRGRRGGSKHQQTFRTLTNPDLQLHRRASRTDHIVPEQTGRRRFADAMVAEESAAPEAAPGEPAAPAPAEVSFTAYDLNIPFSPFWSGRPLSLGCTVEVDCHQAGASADDVGGVMALMVKSWTRDEAGIWAEVKILGAHPDWAWQEGVRSFSRKKMKVHFCNLQEGLCPLHSEPGFHITAFRVFEPGILPLDYVDRKRRKDWEAAMAEFGIAQDDEDIFPPEPPDGAGGVREREEEDPELALARERIGSLRTRLFEQRPHLASTTVPGRTGIFPALGGPSQGFVKEEKAPRPRENKTLVVAISDEEEKSKRKTASGKPQAKSVGSALKEAINKRSRLVEEQKLEERRKKKRKKDKARGRSRSKKKKKKRKSTTSSMTTGSSSSSSTERHMPPLQRRATKKPGSVLALLLEHVAESLAQTALEDPDEATTGLGSSSSKTMTYFQVMVRPQIPAKTRDLRELETLARGIDYLRAGKVEQLGDLLSGRFIALENAALTGSWQTAQWLEVAPARVPGLAQTSLLLETQKHGRIVDRASGRGSWQRPKGDQWSNYGRSQAEDATGKTKGKGGKNKSKGKKGKKSSWNEKPPAETNAEGGS